MDIVIPTYGRTDRQTTYWTLPPTIRKSTFLVVQEREAHLYNKQYELIVLPPEIEDIANTRQFINETMGPKVCVLDDDLVFATRRDDDPTKFHAATEEDIDIMFGDIEHYLGYFAHVGVSHREGANRNTNLMMYANRQLRIHAYRTDILNDLRIRLNRVQFMEDFDVTLQLLRSGYPNAILNSWVHNQGGSDTSGGCSTYRTPAAQTEAAHLLKKLHPKFVTVVKKQTKTAWGGGERHDVRVQWKKALQSSGNADVLDCGKVLNFKKEGSRAGGSME